MYKRLDKSLENIYKVIVGVFRSLTSVSYHRFIIALVLAIYFYAKQEAANAGDFKSVEEEIMITPKEVNMSIKNREVATALIEESKIEDNQKSVKGEKDEGVKVKTLEYNDTAFKDAAYIVKMKYKGETITVPYDSENLLHRKKILLLSNPTEIYKGVKLYSSKQYKELKDITQKILKEHLKEREPEFLEDETYLDNLQTIVADPFVVDNKERELDIDTTNYKGMGYTGVKKAIDLLDKRELTLLKDTMVFDMAKVMRPRGVDDARVNAYATRDFRTGGVAIMMGSHTRSIGSDIDSIKSHIKRSKRIALHEIGHVINYKLTKVDDFWDKIKTDADNEIENYDHPSSHYKRSENFTENFVMMKAKELNKEFAYPRKLTYYPYSEDFKYKYNDLLNELIIKEYLQINQNNI